ncbi:dimethylarginine dimethylaminohydrolase family protein [Rossellomorea vietnamensis]|uniref:dimethylarginine dimethylaminohydrolase family protein n=1 Tax=Rossellomorea vietnamensis TaxID=218284 RepID=UPI001E5306DF|nr:dimethylarginine dimethylaminohydrolase family protein [Rossellomorea vietnamensis]MCC5801988.1 dimethylarginine dimethylaminohydrolase family protein [Rossellomorea vietnamensis]
MSLNSPLVPKSKTHCTNEYGKLKKVVVVSPENMQINEIINETQKHFLKENIDIDKAVSQHKAFVEALEKNGSEVIHLQPSPEFNEQVFTRDIGFTIHDQFFVASMNTDVRRGEVKTLKHWLEENEVPHTELLHSIEGGDVLVDEENIWIGVSGRTNQLAIQSLRNQLTPYTVHELPLREDILHLDCVFTIISSEWALVYPPAFSKEDFATIKKHYNIITVTDEEQFQMGPNVLAIGNQKIISLTQNQALNKRIRAEGFDVIELDLSEIIKSGGSFRCCTLPLIRE